MGNRHARTHAHFSDNGALSPNDAPPVRHPRWRRVARHQMHGQRLLSGPFERKNGNGDVE
jgi:hypothetical protein